MAIGFYYALCEVGTALIAISQAGLPSLVVTSGVVSRIAEMASLPLVLLDAYSGEGNWSQWI